MSDSTAQSMTVTCASCNAQLRLRASAIGKRVKCPKCGQTTPIESPNAAPVRDTGQPDTARISCPECHASLKLPAGAAGKRIRCPKCEARIAVPVAERELAPAATTVQMSDDLSLLDGLGGGETVDAPSEDEWTRARPTLAPLRAIKPCPSCGVGLNAESVLCVACGYDLRTGKLAAGTAMAGKLKEGLGALGGMTRLGGTIFMGCICASIGAAIGGAIWVGLARATNIENGWIAWALGGMTGFGMAVGYGKSTPIAGILAAVISVLGIVAAKFTVFYMVMSPLLSTIDSHQSAAPRDRLAELMAYDLQEEVDLPDTDSEAEQDAAEEKAFAAAGEKAKTKVAGMNDAEVKSKLDEIDADTRKLTKSVVGTLFFPTMFGLMDLVFFGLAIVTAFRVGYGFTRTN